MKIRLYNNDSTDYVDYEGTIDEIRKAANDTLKSPTWRDGWSKVLEE